jgi:crotonobetainyl-CoA:carnitine CoA-transferase CaiB-like acyl-CoA transferase
MDHPAPPERARALAGLRVLDFSIMLAGPYCARLLADLGADVVKIEPPEGDDMRLRHPLRADAEGQRHSTYFGQLNAGKRSIALDLKRPESVALVKRLALQADVVVENFRPGVMQRLGLGADVLRALNPRLVFCSISGYGQGGANADRAAYAMLVQAESGFERTLARWAAGGEHGGRPVPTATFVADLLGGLYGFAAIQAALVQRARTGEGQVVDVALMDSMLNLLVYELQEAQFPLKAPRPIYGPVAAADGDVLIAPITERNFQALAEVTQLPALREDARFATLQVRSANWPAMMAVVEQWTRPRTVADVVRVLEAAGVPCARYNEPGDCLRDEPLRARGVFAPVEDAAGAFTGVNAPWQMSAGGSAIGARVARVGEHTDAVLREWLDLPAAEAERLRAAGATR